MAGSLTVASVDSGASATAPVFKANGAEIGTLCRAWVNFDGTNTPSIRAAFNVGSITDGGTGNFTVNFTTSLTDANYSVVISLGLDSSLLIGRIGGGTGIAPLASAFYFESENTSTGANVDPLYADLAFFR